MEYSKIHTLMAVILILNILASFYVGRAVIYDKAQKKIQIILIWLFPFFAATGFSYFLWCERRQAKLKRKRQVGNGTHLSNADAISHASAYYQNK
ncbi:hypothetical protein ACU6U9_00245 [Pseudomonas sp. HK3]